MGRSISACHACPPCRPCRYSYRHSSKNAGKDAGVAAWKATLQYLGDQGVRAVGGIVAERFDHQEVGAGREVAGDAGVGVAAAIVVFIDHRAVGIEQHQIGVEFAGVEAQVDSGLGRQVHPIEIGEAVVGVLASGVGND